MCGIAGIVGRGAAAQADIARAVSALAHRGPDDRGVHHSGEAVLGHTRLSIIDLTPLAHQPMVDEATGVAVVFNGEIYNYQDLRRQMPDAVFRGHSDTEVLLHLYLREGTRSVLKLRGMFGLAIWDPRDKTLHLARDPFGIKPLYYGMIGRSLVFGSEVKALLALGVRASANRRVFRDYLVAGGFAADPETFFEGISSVDAGTVLSVHDGACHSWRYWSPLDAPCAETIGRDPGATVWGGFLDSIRHHVVSDVPVAISLSSGLDSLAIVHALAQVGVREMHAFTYGFSDRTYDEVSRIKPESLPIELHHHTIQFESEELLPLLDEAISFYEAPLGGVGTVGIFKLMRCVRAQGLKVLLSGEGSDEIFAGYKYYYYDRFRDLYDAGETDILARELQAFESFYGERLSSDSESFKRMVLDRDGVRLAPDGSAMTGDAILGPALIELGERCASRRGREDRAAVRERLRGAMLRDLVADRVPKQLWYDDRGGMASSVEVRVPFLDRPLYGVTRCLPADWLIRDGESKYALRYALQRFCGLDLHSVPKHFVSTPQREWFRGPLYSAVLQRVRDSAFATSDFIDLEAFLGNCEAYAGQSELGNSFFMWKVLNAALLYDAYFAGSPRA